jgi:hypothetical protein
MKTMDVGQLIDEGSWSGFQILLIFGTALTPPMMKDWSFSAFVNVSVRCLAFAVLTLAIAHAKTLAWLLVLCPHCRKGRCDGASSFCWSCCRASGPAR